MTPKDMPNTLSRDRLWYKDAIIYQLHVRGFYDSNGDGIGDFKGLVSKLDYLRDLGVTAVWIQPFYPSPLRDDGYDIADYETVNPSYGDLADFKEFLDGAHKRGIRVITELVINHTSDQHEWFQKSRRAEPGSYWRDFYVWSDTPSLYKEVRIIFKDFEPSNWTWDPVAKAYFWHRFFNHQPDLNFDNPEVRKRIFGLADYWMQMGVDGVRLDAIPYLFERDGTSCENLPETHAFLKEFRAYVEARYPNAMLLAEANMWPDDAAAYFGDGDECHMNFHFPLMPRLFMALKMEDRFSIIDILRQTPEIPENCQWATFLRNHDELTLEMVTDEERDYMYKAYASETRARINLGIRRRLAPLLQNNRLQIQLLNGLLFALPGTPIIYFGDEIGMGDNIYLGDRNGVRTPFQWSPDRNAGFSSADPQKLYQPVIMTPEYHYTTVNVENQQANPNSLLRWMKDLIEMRKRNVALTRGTLNFLEPQNQKVLAFVRDHDDGKGGGQKVLVLANLSRRAQYVELDLAAYRGMVPVELRGDTAFPSIGDLPYLLTLGPYDFYYFELTNQHKIDSAQWLLRDNSDVTLAWDLRDLMNNPGALGHIQHMLASFLPKARWFAGKGMPIRRIVVTDAVEVPHQGTEGATMMLFAEVQYRDEKETVETYIVTITNAVGERAENILRDRADMVIGEYTAEDGSKGVYHEAIIDAPFARAVLDIILRQRVLNGHSGTLKGKTYGILEREIVTPMPEPELMGLEQSNSSLRFGKSYYLKLFRKIEEGLNPEIEIGAHIGKSDFGQTPHLIGSMQYKAEGREYSLAVVNEHVESTGSAWDLVLNHIENFARVAEGQPVAEAEKLLEAPLDIFDVSEAQLPDWLLEEAGYTSTLMHLLGQRTAELHKALGNGESNPDFTPEDITPFYQRSLYQSLRNRAGRSRFMLEKESPLLAKRVTQMRSKLFDQWPVVERQFSGIKTRPPFGGQRIRIHGDYHLGQLLFTGKDFIILDFEGEPMRPLSARRLKLSPLQDVAGMLRSLDYAIYFYAKDKIARDIDRDKILPWLRVWSIWMSHQFLAGYLEGTEGTALLPPNRQDVRYLIEVLLLDKALYEVGYEIGSRPQWVEIPLTGILSLLPTLTAGKVVK